MSSCHYHHSLPQPGTYCIVTSPRPALFLFQVLGLQQQEPCPPSSQSISLQRLPSHQSSQGVAASRTSQALCFSTNGIWDQGSIPSWLNCTGVPSGQAVERGWGTKPFKSHCSTASSQQVAPAGCGLLMKPQAAEESLWREGMVGEGRNGRAQELRQGPARCASVSHTL